MPRDHYGVICNRVDISGLGVKLANTHLSP
jgi:hypothetical protein